MTDAQDKPTQDSPEAATLATGKPGKKAKANARKPRAPKVTLSVGEVRRRGAQVVWFICVLFALFLAVGALTYALNANPDNGLVDFVRTWANRVDLGVFSPVNGIKEFTGDNADVKNALFNWGLGSLFWLVLGRILDRVLRP
jgi:hypothetical protein